MKLWLSGSKNKGKKNRTKIKKDVRMRVYQRDEGACVYCDKKLTMAEATMDHIVPWSKGGRSSFKNLVLCCQACNQLKADYWDINERRI